MKNKTSLPEYSKWKIASTVEIIYQNLQSNASLILICVLVGLSHLLYQGYQFGIWNHAIQIPILKSYFHPELYPNDAMVATRSYYVTFYFMFLALLERIFGHLEFIFFTAFLITEILFFIAIYHLAYAVFKDRNVAIIAIILFFTSKIIVGGDLTHWNHHNHTHAVLPLIFFSFVLFLAGRRRKAYGLLGFGANIHIQSVIYVLPMFGLVSLLEFFQNRKDNGWRKGILKLLIDYGMFILFSLPVLIWALSKSGSHLTSDWIAQLYARSKHHSFPLSWDVKEYINYLVFFAFGVLLWSMAVKNSEDRKIHWKFGWFALVILVLCGMAVIFSEIYPVKLIMRTQFFRSTKFLTIFITLYSCYIIKYLWSRNSPGKFLAFSTFLVIFLPEYLKFLVLLLLIYQLAESRKIFWGVLVFVAGVFILRIHVKHEVFPDKIVIDEITKFIKPFFEDKLRASLLILLVFWLAVMRQAKKWMIYSSAATIILVTIFYILPATYKEVVPPINERGEWVNLQLWAKENTPLDAMFITPPNIQGFRVYSERGTVVEWKDGTQQYFDIDYSYEWWKRSNDIGMEDKTFYNNLTTEKFKKLCKKYDASYIVTPAGKKLELPTVYENKDYQVYKCDN